MKKTIGKNIPKANIDFKQPVGLHIIAIMVFCLCLCVAPFVTLLTHYGDINFFYNRNDHIFVMFFAGVFGCISNYFFGSTKSIIHGLQFIIIAIILSFIKNIYLFSLAALWTGVSVVIVNLLFNLSSFYLKTDSRRLYGFIGVYSSALLGIAVGLFICFIVLKDAYLFKLFYLFTIIFLLIFFLKNSYKLNTSLTSQTERVDVSFYGVLIIFFIFSVILFYLLLNLKVFSSLNLIVLPISLVYLHVLTVTNNKETGLELLKYVYFSLVIIVLNKIIYLTFLKYDHNSINPKYINSVISTFIFLMFNYILCIAVYIAWRFKIISLKIESIINSKLIKTMLYLEVTKVFILVLAVFIANNLVSNIIFMVSIILSIVLNIFIVPIYFSLGKILAGGKNETITTTLLYLIYSSLVFVSFLYDISIKI
ncbi:hypothetical protein IB642_06390 [Allofrancisella guangzhouensis]|uniref:Membrane protein n=1 Tax=Allofrancisella guangzhouensis TaxID=594679 RepID=A0A0A8E5M8_9GAMM|nr:hypothetical protein [Allofrancisella guangzhouensis]AJC49313.1 membrane protein [Allofrancisella guangzhouensis]MBK2027213.1 hypothetical protein [Allofrancisella guangzhouensis]MBK2044649.1 hypothetical protein [Allofrancisella guangzhouensis]MBK2045068.1 hypothetical protein [Allofrancisella guangzhouensis]